MTLTVITPWLFAARDDLRGGWMACIQQLDPAAVYEIHNQAPKTREVDWAGIYGRPWTIYSTQDDLGFNRANNHALAQVTTDCVLFLNSDVEPAGPDWFAPIRDVLRPGRLVSPRLVTDEHTRVDGRLFPYLEGWCIAGYTDDFRTIGGWDETLREPAYWGDNLLSLRARQAGLRLCQAEAPIRHIGNATSSLDVERREAASAYNRERFIEAAREEMARV